MKKFYIILNLVFLFFISGSINDEEIIKDIINEEIIGEVLDTKNKIFLNVIDKDKMYVPLEKDGEEIKWEFDSKYLSLEGNQFEVKKDGIVMLSATYQNKIHLYSITIKNDTITNTIQYDLKFYYQFIKDSKKIGKKIKPNKIVFHNTANTAPAINEIKWLNSKDNTSTTSFHFAVDESGVYQAVSTNYATYHAGDFNINNSSIGIEIAKSKLDNIEEKDNGIKNATLLIVLLMNYYDIDIENVITHYDSSGKYCPHDIFDRYGLENFYNDIKKLV